MQSGYSFNEYEKKAEYKRQYIRTSLQLSIFIILYASVYVLLVVYAITGNSGWADSETAAATK